MFFWPIAANDPSAIEAIETNTTICCHCSVMPGKRRQRHAGKDRERRDLRGGSKESRNRCRRTFIDVGRPHVERHRRNLEAKPGEQEHDAEHDTDAAGLGRSRDAGKADRAGKAIDQRGAVEQHARGQRAQHEILQACFGRFGVVAVGGGDHVERKAHQLEPEIEHDQIARRDQNHHAERRKQHQNGIFEDAPGRIGQKLRREEKCRGRTDQRQNLQEAGEVVDDEATVEGRQLAGRQRQFQDANDHE